MAAALGLGVGTLYAPANAAPVAVSDKSLVQGAPDYSDLVAKVSPAVVAITVTQMADDEVATIPPELRGTPFERFFDQGRQAPQRAMRALGSGFVIDSDGYIVTNNHVVTRAKDVSVVFVDGTKLVAKVVGVDSRTDLALLKVETDKPLTAVALGDSDKVRPGQPIIAVGNPFGLGGTVTNGIVSARGREIGQGPLDDFIQIDAPINQGNSGGPSFDMAGNVIGVNSAIYSPSGGSVGLGFAIPSNVVKSVVAQLREKGHVDRAWMGVAMQDISPAMAKAIGLKTAKGALIVDVSADSPAASAGLQRGDAIVSIDGAAIDDGRTLARKVAALPRDTKIDVGVWRDGKQQTVAVKLGTAPEQQAASGEGKRDGAHSSAQIGLALAPTPDRTGAMVRYVRPDSAAEEAGFRPGDVIVEIDRAKIGSPDEAMRKLAAARDSRKSAVAVMVERDGRPMFLGLTFEPAKG
jgi:serine protease Do